MTKLSSKNIITISGMVLFFMSRADAQSCEDIFNKMFIACKDVRTLRADMTSRERIADNHVNYTHYAVKLNAAPYKAYSKNLDKGVEILYLQGENNNEATVNPNGFPYVNLHLDPSGTVMHKDQHQTIRSVGFAYISNMLYHTLAKYSDAYTQNVKKDADTVWDGSLCYKLEINFPTYTNTTYIVKEAGETVSELAAKYYLSEYQILVLNNISGYDDELKVGQHLILPSDYAKYTVLFVRKDNYLPVVIRIFDDKGFFEEYAYSNLQLNVTIPDAEFTEHYPGYHF